MKNKFYLHEFKTIINVMEEKFESKERQPNT